MFRAWKEVPAESHEEREGLKVKGTKKGSNDVLRPKEPE
jgi:hypothetical protein